MPHGGERDCELNEYVHMELSSGLALFLCW